ncbi:MAG: signal peptidase I [Candidatus Hydrogenedentes bacterium]|nr:signal peptidase I [Candidatus Hydrogenedentota bacterium]
MSNKVLQVVEKIVGPLTKENAVQWLQCMVVAGLAALTIRHFSFEPFKIPSGSMIPTLQIGDKILVNKFILGSRIPFTYKKFLIPRRPARGDIVVFRSATGERKDLVKRVAGLPGERIKISDDGHVLVNGEPVTSPPFIANNTYYNHETYGSYGTIREVTVPEDSYFVLGDNSKHSRDSRTWGFLPMSHIKGKVICVWWPLWKARKVR